MVGLESDVNSVSCGTDTVLLIAVDRFFLRDGQGYFWRDVRTCNRFSYLVCISFNNWDWIEWPVPYWLSWVI